MPPAEHAALDVHRRLLERWRGAMDLVGPGPVEPHFQDARAAVGWLGPWLPTGGERAPVWADLGSGAGFPGIALAAYWPHIRVLLVERRQKRAVFLENVVAEAGLTNAEVRCAGVDDLASGSLDGVISRAFAPPREVLEHAARLLAPGGRLVLLLALEPVPEDARFREVRTQTYRIGGKERRAVLLERG